MKRLPRRLLSCVLALALGVAWTGRAFGDNGKAVKASEAPARGQGPTVSLLLPLSLLSPGAPIPLSIHSAAPPPAAAPAVAGAATASPAKLLHLAPSILSLAPAAGVDSQRNVLGGLTRTIERIKATEISGAAAGGGVLDAAFEKSAARLAPAPAPAATPGRRISPLSPARPKEDAIAAAYVADTLEINRYEDRQFEVPIAATKPKPQEARLALELAGAANPISVESWGDLNGRLARLNDPAAKNLFLLSVGRKLRLRASPVLERMTEAGLPSLIEMFNRRAETIRAIGRSQLVKNRRMSESEAWDVIDGLMAKGVEKVDLPYAIEEGINKGSKLESFKPRILNGVEAVFARRARGRAFRLEEGWNRPAERSSFTADPGLVRRIDTAARRSRRVGHTLSNINDYIRRHFSDAFMAYVASNPKTPILVFGGSMGHVHRELFARGLTEIVPFNRGLYAGSDKLVARNPETGEEAIVFVAAPGQGHLAEIVGDLLYHEPADAANRIQSERITVLRATAEGGARATFAYLLKEHNLDPDVVVIGYGGRLFERMVSELDSKAYTIQAPNFSGRVYDLNGRQVLSLAIELSVFADRTGEFIEALDTLPQKERTVIFTGNGGAVDATVEPGDLIVPGTITIADDLSGVVADGFHNSAIEPISRMFPRGPPAGLMIGARHASVSNLHVEDNAWLSAQRSQGTAIVEQEVYSLAAATARRNRRPGASKFSTHVILDVSDRLGDPESDFLHYNTRRRVPRHGLKPVDLVIELLRMASSAANATPKPRATAAGEAPKRKAARRGKHVMEYAGQTFTVEADPRIDETTRSFLKAVLDRLAERSFSNVSAFEAALREKMGDFATHTGYRVLVEAQASGQRYEFQ